MNLKHIYLKIYRVFGFTFLVSLTAAIVLYAGLMIFFLFNSSWVAPAVLSPTSDRMLQFSAAYQTAIQNQVTLQALESQTKREADLAHDNAQRLRRLQEKFLKYNAGTAVLVARRQQDLEDSDQLSTGLDDYKNEAQQDLKAGLITKAEEIQLLSYIQIFHNEVATGSLNLGTTRMTIANNEVQLLQQLAQTESDEKTKQEAHDAAKKSLALASKLLDNLERSSYRQALNNGANLAFVPYENMKAVKPGTPIYDCYLLIAACHQVGVVDKIYEDEQVTEFPIFNIRFSRTIRGVFLSMKMDSPESMGSSLFFAGGKPLFL